MINQRYLITRATASDNENLTAEARVDRIETRAIFAAIDARAKLAKLHADLKAQGVERYNADF